MNNKIYILIIFFIISVLSSYSQVGTDLQNSTVTIKGTVIDDNKDPVPLTKIQVEGTGYGTMSDLNGKYIFSCPTSDSLVVSFSMIGYETRKRVLTNPIDTIVLNVMIFQHQQMVIALVVKKDII